MKHDWIPHDPHPKGGQQAGMRPPRYKCKRCGLDTGYIRGSQFRILESFGECRKLGNLTPERLEELRELCVREPTTILGTYAELRSLRLDMLEMVNEVERLQFQQTKALDVLADIDDHSHGEDCDAPDEDCDAPDEDHDEPPMTTAKNIKHCTCTVGVLWRVREALKDGE